MTTPSDPPPRHTTQVDAVYRSMLQKEQHLRDNAAKLLARADELHDWAVHLSIAIDKDNQG